MLKLGLKACTVKIVDENDLANVAGSGALPVFSTPMLILLMEKTAAELVMPYLDNGMATVGISVNMKHVAATAAGDKVSCNAELVEIDRKRLVFKIEAFDEHEKIGDCIHERFIVDKEKFMQKLGSKQIEKEKE